MNRSTDAADAVHTAIAQSCEMIGVEFAQERIDSVLSAFEGGVSWESIVVLAMAGGDHGGDLDYNFTIPTEAYDPYERAVDRGLIKATKHPVSTLLSDLTKECRINFTGVECGVIEGFKKTYAFFPLDALGTLDTLISIPSMPKGVAAHAEVYSELGLADRISIIGIDYRRRTMNIYFMAGSLNSQAVDRLIEDAQLPPISDPELVDFVKTSFSVYPTFSWEDDRVSRICFSSVSPDQNSYPTRVDKEIARFVKAAPYEYSGPRVLVFGPTVSPHGVYHKLGVYFRRPESFWRNLPLASTFERLASELPRRENGVSDV